MSFTCVSASIPDTDGYDNFHTANALKTVGAKKYACMCIYQLCVGKTWAASDAPALPIGICSDFKTHLFWQRACLLYNNFFFF